MARQINTITPGDHLAPADPPVCCRQAMTFTEGVLGQLYECPVCEDGIYVAADGRVLDVMRGN